MTLRNRLLAAVGACLLVTIAAFFGVERRQEQVLLDQLDEQLTRAASTLAARAPQLRQSSLRDNLAQGPLPDNGELYVGVVVSGEVITLATPSSGLRLIPDPEVIKRTSRDVPVTVNTSDGDSQMRVIVQGSEGVAVVVGQSVGLINDAVRSLRISGLTAVALIGAFAALVGLWVNRLGIRPLRAATGVAHAITSGRRDERVPEGPANTEAATLGSAMNLMLDVNAETEARLRSFVADASHELRTPLTTLIGYADLHRQGLLTSDESVDDAMRRIHGEAKRMTTIVEHLLLLANLDERTAPLHLVPVEIGQLLQDVAADTRVVQPDRAITVDASAGGEVDADPEQLLQAVLAVVTNALVHTPTSASLTLELNVGPEMADIRIIDRGPGIAPEHLDRLFDRFYRGDGTAHRKGRGSGLGLAIARSIVEAHEGRLTVESVVGHGSTFVISLPLRRGIRGVEVSPSG